MALTRVGRSAERTLMGGNVTNVTLTDAQLKRLDPALRRACEVDNNTRMAVANALRRGLDYQYINQYYKDNSSLIEGLIVEREDDGSVKPPAENTAELAAASKDNREVITSQWQGYYRERYQNNPEEAKHDMVRLLCHKEVKKVQVGYSDLWRATGFDPKNPEKRNASMRLRIAYINRTPEKQAEFEKKVKEFVEQNKDKLKDEKLITAYRDAFAPKTLGDNIATNTRGTIEELTEADLKALAQYSVLNEMTAVGGPNGMTEEEVAMACEEMAIDAITDRNVNGGLVKMNEYKEEIKHIKQQYSNMPAIKERTATYFSAKVKMEELIEKEQDPKKKAELEKQLADLTTKYEAECFAQLPEKVQKKINKLEKKIAEEGKKANDKENEFMNKNMDALVEMAAEAQVQIDIQKQKYDKHVVPAYASLDKDVQKFIQLNPNEFCHEAKEGELVAFEADGKKYTFDPQKFKERMLYYSQRGRTSGDAQKNQEGCDYFCDLAEVDNCFKGVKFGGLGDDEKVKRSLVKKAMDAAGISTETDRTALMRMGHILKSAAIGAVTDAVGVLAADGIAMLKTCEFTEQIFELAQMTKMIPVSLTDNVTLKGKFTKDYDLSGDNGTWSFNKNYHLEGDDASWSGEGFWSYDDEVIVDHVHNGILIDQNTIPIHADGTVDVSGNNGHWTYDLVVDESGNNAHWEYTHHVNEDVEVSGDVTLRGEVKNPDANRELYEKMGEKKNKVRPKFSDADVYKKAAIYGAIAGAIGGALTAHNIKDKGLRKDAEAMRVISQKEVRKPKVEEPPAPPDDEGEEEEELLEDECRSIDGEEGTPEQAAENVYNLPMNKKGNVIFWYQTAEAYKIPDGLTTRDVYNEVRNQNGDPNHDKYPPAIVGLPEQLTIVKNGVTYVIDRKDSFTIKGIDYKPPKGTKGKGKGVGKTYVGRPAVAGKPGNYRVYRCEDGTTIQGGFASRAQAEDWVRKNPPAKRPVK